MHECMGYAYNTWFIVVLEQCFDCFQSLSRKPRSLLRLTCRQQDRPDAFAWPFIYVDSPRSSIDVGVYPNHEQDIKELVFDYLLSRRDRFAIFVCFFFV